MLKRLLAFPSRWRIINNLYRVSQTWKYKSLVYCPTTRKGSNSRYRVFEIWSKNIIWIFLLILSWFLVWFYLNEAELCLQHGTLATFYTFSHFVGRKEAKLVIKCTTCFLYSWLFRTWPILSVYKLFSNFLMDKVECQHVLSWKILLFRVHLCIKVDFENFVSYFPFSWLGSILSIGLCRSNVLAIRRRYIISIWATEWHISCHCSLPTICPQPSLGHIPMLTSEKSEPIKVSELPGTLPLGWGRCNFL